MVFIVLLFACRQGLARQVRFPGFDPWDKVRKLCLPTPIVTLTYA